MKQSRNGGDQRLGVQTTIGTLVDNGDIDNNDGNRHRSKRSIRRVGNSGAVAVSQKDFEEKFLQMMGEWRSVLLARSRPPCVACSLFRSVSRPPASPVARSAVPPARRACIPALPVVCSHRCPPVRHPPPPRSFIPSCPAMQPPPPPACRLTVPPVLLGSPVHRSAVASVVTGCIPALPVARLFRPSCLPVPPSLPPPSPFVRSAIPCVIPPLAPVVCSHHDAVFPASRASDLACLAGRPFVLTRLPRSCVASILPPPLWSFVRSALPPPGSFTRSVRSSVRPSVRSFVRSAVRSFAFVRSFVRSFVPHPPVCACVRSLLRP